ncbi:hypothetical protein ABIE18_004296 [Arthrobacter sp. 2762]
MDMSITVFTLTEVLEVHDIPARFRRDPELLGIAYALAALDEPADDVARSFYDSETTLPADTVGGLRTPVSNGELLRQIHMARLTDRLHALTTPDIQSRTG